MDLKDLAYGYNYFINIVETDINDNFNKIIEKVAWIFFYYYYQQLFINTTWKIKFNTKKIMRWSVYVSFLQCNIIEYVK